MAQTFEQWVASLPKGSGTWAGYVATPMGYRPLSSPELKNIYQTTVAQAPAESAEKVSAPISSAPASSQGFIPARSVEVPSGFTEFSRINPGGYSYGDKIKDAQGNIYVFGQERDISGKLISASTGWSLTNEKRISSTPSNQTYTVKSGDTLSKIAQQLGVGVSAITGYRSGNPNLIYPGEVLTVNKAQQNINQPISQNLPSQGAGDNQIQISNNKAIVENAASEANRMAEGIFNNIKDEDVSTRESYKLLQKIEESLAASPVAQPQSMVEIFNSKKAELGIDLLESELNSIDSEIASINQSLLTESQKAGERLVGMAEITQRRGKLQTEASQRIAELNIEKTSVANRLNNKYSTLNTIMTLTQQDYANSTNYYNSQYNKAIDLYNLIKGQEQIETTANQKLRDDSQANLNVLWNLMKTGALTYDKLTPGQKLLLGKLEIQAGYPAGISQTVISSGTEEAFHIVSDDQTSVSIIKKDGSVEVKSTGLAASGTADPFQKALDKEIANLYSGMYGTTGARERVMNMLKSQFPDKNPQAIIDMVMAKAPDNWEKNIVGGNIPGKVEEESLKQNLADAKTAIDQGADRDKVRQRFIEKHPKDGKTFDDYIGL